MISAIIEDLKMHNLIDLHLHLDGSLPVSSVKKILAKEGKTMSDQELKERLSVGEDCQNLAEYLDKFNFLLELMQSAENLHLLTCNLLKDLRSQGLVYAEIRFAPQQHTKTLTQAEAVQAVIAGLEDFYAWQKEQADDRTDLHAQILLCLMRLEGVSDKNWETVKVAKEFLGQGVAGIDLAGPENEEVANRKFAPFFAKAKELGIPYTIHAGEAMGPESVKEALAMGTKRIGHGIRSMEDPELIKKLVQDQITLECCASSNLNTKIFNDLSQYPLRKLLAKKVQATVNTDNMTVSQTNLPREYKLLESIGLTSAEEKQVYLNAVNAAFCDQAEKERLLDLVR